MPEFECNVVANVRCSALVVIEAENEQDAEFFARKKASSGQLPWRFAGAPYGHAVESITIDPQEAE